MFTCPTCSKNFDSLRSISLHINKKHQQNSKDIIFGLYPNLFRNCLFCDKKIKQYASDRQSRKFCGKECEILWRKSIKQSQETINKRIKNTNQKKKEKSRQKTMLEKYGALQYCPNTEEKSKKISKALLGSKHTEEHHIKVILSKKRNGTLKHTQQTKEKISKKLTETLNSPGFDKSKLIRQTKNSYKQGYYKGFYCRSSYEKTFIDFCEEYKINLISAETNEFAVNYKSSDGKNKTYFPDFYLVDFDLVVEIKPISMYNYGDNDIKFNEAKLKHRFEVITEENHLLDKKNWKLLYEYICLV